MYYYTPDVNRYIKFILRYRAYIIFFTFFFTLFMTVMFTPKFLSSDELFWLKDSQQLEQTQSKKLSTYHLTKLTVRIDDTVKPFFDEEVHQSLSALHKEILALEGVEKVHSLFNNDFVENKKSDEESEMLTIINTGDMDTLRLQKLVKDLNNDYSNLVDDDFKTFNYFISGDKFIDISTLDIPGTYTYDQDGGAINWYFLGSFLLFLLLITFIIFNLLFRCKAAFYSAVLLITFTTALSFTTIVMVTGIETIHVSMIFITISITLVDFLYFYYRWHVSQYKVSRDNALVKMLNRNMMPAMWTSIITVLGLGSLLFIDSDIIKLLSLSVILASVLSYLLNLTFLPSFLSYYEVTYARVPYTKIGYLLTTRSLHYNKKFLFGFLGVVYLLLIVGGYMLYGKSNNFFKLNVKNEQMELKIPYKQIDLPFIQSIEKFSESLQERFEDEIDEVSSISTLIHNLNDSNSQTDELDEDALQQALFYIDLYDMSEKYFDENAVNIVINLSDINKVDLIEWLMNYEGIELYFVDNATLIGSAKYNKAIMLTSSILTALVIIGLIIGWIFQAGPMVFLGLTINAIPLVLFGTIVTILAIPLSIEMLIAMSISLGLASDATIHFAFKYFRFRYFGRTQKQTLAKIYFYSGIPVIIGSVMLIGVFLMLYFSQVESLKLIGLYSSILISLSLFTDLFIIPVILLLLDNSGKINFNRNKS